MADGVTGKVAIMQSGSRAAFENPKDNLSKIHFHSDLDYMGIVQQLFISRISFPRRYNQRRTVEAGSKKGKGGWTYEVAVPVSGTQYYNIGTLVGDIDGPLLAFKDNFTPMTSLPIWSVTNGNTFSMRSIALIVQGQNIILCEKWFTLWEDIPEQSIDNIKIVKFNMMLGANLTSTKTLEITPTRFIASRGKLDSQNRYVHRSSTGPYFMFYGPTMNCDNGGGQWAQVDGNGNVSYVQENGYQSNTAFYTDKPIGLSI